MRLENAVIFPVLNFRIKPKPNIVAKIKKITHRCGIYRKRFDDCHCDRISIHIIIQLSLMNNHVTSIIFKQYLHDQMSLHERWMQCAFADPETDAGRMSWDFM
jgi:hypothetical protein